MSAKPRMLVVDNEMDVCNFVKSFFELRGFDVVATYNGDEAMKVLEQVKPDVVILDVMMRREHEGLEFLPLIKKKIPSAKIIMITGVDDKDVIRQSKELGADDYITKPLVLEYLESTVMNKVKNLSRAKDQ